MKDYIARVIRRHLSLNPMVFRLTGCMLLCLATGSAAQAGTAITETTGAGNLGTQVLPPSGNIYGITDGTPAGNNLYHSFVQFSVGTGDVAQFQTSTLSPNSATSNILARVTGGNPSSIFGTVDSATYYPGASFFLMNPNGIIFGPNATLNVGGSVTFTTANNLRLTDTGIFHADPASTSVLTSASVAAFGFLGGSLAAISVEGSTLSVQPGQMISLVGANQGFTYTNPDTGATTSVPDGVTMTGGGVSVPSGQINVVSVASAGEISAVDFMPTSAMTMGNIALSLGAILDVSGDGGGIIRIRGGQLTMDNAALVADSSVGTLDPATEINLDIQGDITLSHQSEMRTTTQGAGFGGDMEISAANLHMSESSFLQTASFGAGKAGDIRLTLSGDVSLTGAADTGISGLILSDSNGSGPGGSVTVTSSSMTVTALGMVMTRAFGTNRAGNINIDTTTLNVIGGGVVQTQGISDMATSGNISIRATDSVTLAGPGEITILNENIGGGTGTISIEAGRLELRDQGKIFSNTFFDSDPATANQAKISITADSINLSTGSKIDVTGVVSDVGRLELSAQNLTMSGASAITTLANAGGASGPIMINVQDLSVSEGSQIVSSSQGLGRGGDVTINATGSVLLTGQGPDPFGGTLASGIFSNTFGRVEDLSFTGNAGNISITGQSIEVSHGARVDSSSQLFALGNAGNIDLMAPTITVNGGTISTSTEFAGQAGTITLHANTVTLNNGGQLTSSSIMRQTPLFDGEVIPSPTGSAGSVTIQGNSPAQSVLIDGPGSGIFTDTQGTGAGGNILIETSQSTALTNGATISASSTGTMDNAGDAGMVTIHAGSTFLMQNSSVTTQAIKSGGGQIEINAANLFRLVNSRVSSSVLDGTGGGGNITIDPNVVVLQNSQIIAQAVQGAGGNITIFTPLFLADSTSLVSASSQFGLNGTVTIQNPTSNLSGSLGTLTSKPSQADVLLTQRCAALANGQASSFVMAGREQLPADPGGWLSSPIALAGIDAERFGDGAVTVGTSHLAPRTSDLLANDRVSLRRLTPAGFLIANFADSEATGCHS